jgi:hypothetical protein
MQQSTVERDGSTKMNEKASDSALSFGNKNRPRIKNKERTLAGKYKTKLSFIILFCSSRAPYAALRCTLRIENYLLITVVNCVKVSRGKERKKKK